MKRAEFAAPFVAIVLFFILAIGGCGRQERQTGTYICPMHPEVVQDRPGECPICHMTLVPAKAVHDEPDSNVVQGHSVISIGARSAESIGLRFVAARQDSFHAPIRTAGRVEFDERRVHHVHTRSEGYVEDVRADFAGRHVTKGEPLASFYSPELLATQEEYLLALTSAREVEAREGTVPPSIQALVSAARRRLSLWEVSEAQIDELERTRQPLETIDLYAPISGVVTARMAYHGMKVGPDDTLFDIADISRVWILADVYEYELPRVAAGQSAVVTLSYGPARTWTGTVSYVNPTVDEKTRTVKVRIELANEGGELKPGMFAEVQLEGRVELALIVPDDAVLESGTRKIVFARGRDGRIEPREVVTGGRAGGRTAIVSGLAEGDSVALGANFLLDSESRLRAAIAEGNEAAPAPAHAEHDGAR